MPDTAVTKNLAALAAEITAAYVGSNKLAVSELPALLKTTYDALANAGGSAPQLAQPLVPAVPIRRSVTEDFIICLEDGKKLKSLKRHLNTRFGLTPDQYRAKWGLPSSYPMVAPSYAAARSNLAKQMGLGSKRSAAAQVAAPAPAPTKTTRSAPRKKAPKTPPAA